MTTPWDSTDGLDASSIGPRCLVTGSAGHLGEAIMRTLRKQNQPCRGIDRLPSAYTDVVGDISAPGFVADVMAGITAVVHTATLHKPHVATHSKQDFIDTNVTGTLNLLEAAAAQGTERFVFTSTTSLFGDALRPPPDAPAAWVTEAVQPIPKNIYGVTKSAAEDLCWLFQRRHDLPCVVLRTSRFFVEEDDSASVRAEFADANTKVNDYLYRRVELSDAVQAHLLALDKAPDISFGRFIISATSPFSTEHLDQLNRNAPEVVRALVPEYEAIFAELGWQMFPRIDRVYVNEAARTVLGWQPQYDFRRVLGMLSDGTLPRSELSLQVGRKQYHPEVVEQTFDAGPYPVE